MKKKELGRDDHPGLAIIISKLETFYRKIGKLEQAEKYKL